MLKGKTIAAVVPAYNEESQISMVIDSMPDFVDRIVIVNDFSTDNTSEVVKAYWNSELNKTELQIESNLNRNIKPTVYNPAEIVVHRQNKRELEKFIKHSVENRCETDERIIFIEHHENGGVGAAIATGYKWCKDHDIDCTAVLAGDGQMDPNELEGICRPVIEEGVDYVKGNRLIHRSAWLVIPKVRFFGNSVLGILTKIASGYWHVSDTQTGYTAISLSALKALRLYDIYKSYGMPNDLLVKLNIAFCTMREVEIKPVYNVGEKSKMKIFMVIPRVSWLLIRSFFKRLWIKYLFRDFHPLFLLYNFSFLLLILCVYPFLLILDDFTSGNNVTFQSLIAFVFLFISGSQSFLFAMWMDIQDNERLNR